MTDFEKQADKDIQVWYKAIRKLNKLKPLAYWWHVDDKAWEDMYPEEKACVYYFYWKEMVS